MRNRNKRRAVLSALADPALSGASDREVGRLVGVSHTFVANMRRLPQELANELRAEAVEAGVRPASPWRTDVPCRHCMGTGSVMDEATERRRSRARQLATAVGRGRKTAWELCGAGWVRSAVEAILTESPEWIEKTNGTIALTAKGRQQLLEGGQAR